ncbi:hypothetical protein ABW21_db0208021 [Orbilia brochopaga]|nr:hypothetical protein ABW21_db0208021 [Drechslerella brochopaga]
MSTTGQPGYYPEGGPGCRHVKRIYELCGAEFWGERLHHCGLHPPEGDCRFPQRIQLIQAMRKKCKTCKAADQCEKRANTLSTSIQILEQVDPRARDEQALAQARIDLQSARQEARTWRVMGHSE